MDKKIALPLYFLEEFAVRPESRQDQGQRRSQRFPSGAEVAGLRRQQHGWQGRGHPRAR